MDNQKEIEMCESILKNVIDEHKFTKVEEKATSIIGNYMDLDNCEKVELVATCEYPKGTITNRYYWIIGTNTCILNIYSNTCILINRWTSDGIDIPKHLSKRMVCLQRNYPGQDSGRDHYMWNREQVAYEIARLEYGTEKVEMWRNTRYFRNKYGKSYTVDHLGYSFDNRLIAFEIGPNEAKKKHKSSAYKFYSVQELEELINIFTENESILVWKNNKRH